MPVVATSDTGNDGGNNNTEPGPSNEGLGGAGIPIVAPICNAAEIVDLFAKGWTMGICTKIGYGSDFDNRWIVLSWNHDAGIGVKKGPTWGKVS